MYSKELSSRWVLVPLNRLHTGFYHPFGYQLNGVVLHCSQPTTKVHVSSFILLFYLDFIKSSFLLQVYQAILITVLLGEWCARFSLFFFFFTVTELQEWLWFLLRILCIPLHMNVYFVYMWCMQCCNESPIARVSSRVESWKRKVESSRVILFCQWQMTMTKLAITPPHLVTPLFSRLSDF